MRFAEIEGNRESAEPGRHDPQPTPVAVLVEGVEDEARWRLRTIKLGDWCTREIITGQLIPENIRHYAMQVEFAATTISRLSTIPQDFDNNVYWSRLWSR
ncbi:MAG: hypothetical protein MO852_00330 [Candidatus Devosia euplotis]|nr:hypothetical protein [Candidatus Devosia euplotis]